MEIYVNVEATPNERRRLLGYPDITPMAELLSEMLDDAMMVVVDARLEALSATGQPSDAACDEPGDPPEVERRRAGR